MVDISEGWKIKKMEENRAAAQDWSDTSRGFFLQKGKWDVCESQRGLPAVSIGLYK